MGVSTTVRGWKSWKDFNDPGLTASDKLLFASNGNYTNSQNAGTIYGSNSGGVIRGGDNNSNSPYAGNHGAFSASLNEFTNGNGFAFRCTYLPQ